MSIFYTESTKAENIASKGSQQKHIRRLFLPHANLRQRADKCQTNLKYSSICLRIHCKWPTMNKHSLKTCKSRSCYLHSLCWDPCFQIRRSPLTSGSSFFFFSCGCCDTAAAERPECPLCTGLAHTTAKLSLL